MIQINKLLINKKDVLVQKEADLKILLVILYKDPQIIKIFSIIKILILTVKAHFKNLKDLLTI